MWTDDPEESEVPVQEPSSPPSPPVHDPFRHPPDRLVGYAHAVGFALPGEFPKTKIWLTRITRSFIFLDIFFKFADRSKGIPHMLFMGVDAAMWQRLATVIVPKVVVGRAVKASDLMTKSMKIESPLNRYNSLGVVALTLILLSGPIDYYVDYVLDTTTRPWFDLVGLKE